MVMAPPPNPLIPTGSEALLFLLLWMTGSWFLHRRRAARASRRFGYAYLAVMSAVYLIVPQETALLHDMSPILTHAMAVAVGGLMGWGADGPRLMTELGPWTVVWGCLGIVYMLLGAAAFLTYPAPWRSRAGWTAAMLLTVTLFNVVRIAAVYLLWFGDLRSVSEAVHRSTGVFFSVVIVAVWTAMLRVVPIVASNAPEPAAIRPDPQKAGA